MSIWKYEDFIKAFDQPGMKYLDEAPIEFIKRYAKEYAGLQNSQMLKALEEIAAIPPTGNPALMHAQNIADEAVYLAKIEKPQCKHKTVPTFDGLGVRLKCQTCGEWVSE